MSIRSRCWREEKFRRRSRCAYRAPVHTRTTAVRACNGKRVFERASGTTVSRWPSSTILPQAASCELQATPANVALACARTLHVHWRRTLESLDFHRLAVILVSARISSAIGKHLCKQIYYNNNIIFFFLFNDSARSVPSIRHRHVFQSENSDNIQREVCILISIIIIWDWVIKETLVLWSILINFNLPRSFWCSIKQRLLEKFCSPFNLQFDLFVFVLTHTAFTKTKISH